MSKKILTVDDSASIRQMVSMTLSAAGYEVGEATDGMEGFQKATTTPLHCIVTDLNMPVLNGLEFIRKFRAHPSSKGIPILLLTTETDEALKKQAKEAGAIGWIVKPFKPDQLLATIRKVAG